MRGTSLVVQWLRPHASTAWGTVFISGWRTKILSAVQHGQKNKIKINVWDVLELI